METHGRKTIYANYTEEQLLSGSQKDRDAKVLDILENSVDLFNINRDEIRYLQNYL